MCFIWAFLLFIYTRDYRQLLVLFYTITIVSLLCGPRKKQIKSNHNRQMRYAKCPVKRCMPFSELVVPSAVMTLCNYYRIIVLILSVQHIIDANMCYNSYQRIPMNFKQNFLHSRCTMQCTCLYYTYTNIICLLPILILWYSWIT